uniref:ATP synthase F0 subunit 8 n=1 Tax=Tupiella akineta TaxID=160070 RepID=Q6UVT4_TUPAK|nr:ATP synthase F0 subunit 8 [Tupiella akineta]AAQ18740.1 ATP synthase F0 subunit 8 [Tupiella akineta]
MPQLDTLTYFTQFVFLLVSFIYIYYFVITYIIPNTLTARKLRAKFNSQLESSKGLLQVPSELGGEAFIGELALESLTSEAFTQLACKSAASTTVEDLNATNKTGKHNIQSALMLHYTYALANKKGLLNYELTAA